MNNHITHPDEDQILECFGDQRDKVMGVDFDNEGFVIWLKEPYIFSVNQSGSTGFDYDDQWEGGLLSAVRWDALSVTTK